MSTQQLTFFTTLSFLSGKKLHHHFAISEPSVLNNTPQSVFLFTRCWSGEEKEEETEERGKHGEMLGGVGMNKKSQREPRPFNAFLGSVVGNLFGLWHRNVGPILFRSLSLSYVRVSDSLSLRGACHPPREF